MYDRIHISQTRSEIKLSTNLGVDLSMKFSPNPFNRFGDDMRKRLEVTSPVRTFHEPRAKTHKIYSNFISWDYSDS